MVTYGYFQWLGEDDEDGCPIEEDAVETQEDKPTE